MALPHLPAPPDDLGSAAGKRWMQLLWRKLGEFSDEAPIKAANITGILASANAAPGIIRNLTNDATIDSVDAGASATVRVYGPGGVGSNWNRYRNLALAGSPAAVQFTGKAYSTRYYAALDTVTLQWTISTQLKDVTGDNMVIFSLLTKDAGGGGGASGGGASAAGGSGGVGASGGGYGMLL